MHKSLLKTRQLFARNRFSCWQRFISDSSVGGTHNAESDVSSSTKHVGLDSDSSWEANVLRYERDLDRLRNQGVTEEDLPGFDREEKVKNMQHITFHNKNKFLEEESVLDETSKVMLGAVKDDGEINMKFTTSNFDPEFYREDVQEILNRIHYRCQAENVYKLHVTERKVMPSIKYMNDEELKEEKKKMHQNLTKKIKMPLVMTERKSCSRDLAEDDILDGYEDSNVSFVDISEDLTNRDRFIVVREPSGKLRTAEWNERDRLMQTYYPMPDRTIIPPSLFNKNSIENIFERKLHENALDQCVVQFQADSKEYIEVFKTIYKNIDDQRLYQLLENTRYFSGLVYFLAKKFTIDFLILDMISRKQIENAANCVRLLILLHPNCETKACIEEVNPTDDLSFIEAYLNSDSKEKGSLATALENLSSSEEPEAMESKV